MISDLAYADLMHDGEPAPSIFQVDGARDVAVEFFTVSKSYSMPGWRVGFCVGNRALVGALTNIKGYLDYGSFAPVQLAAATALDLVRRRRGREPRRLQAPREAAVHASWRRSAGRCRCRWRRCSSGRRCRRRPPHLGAVEFASELLERARVAVSPGVGFGPGGEGYVRFSLIENDDRTRRACAAIGEFLARDGPTAVPPTSAPHVDKAAGLK